MAGVKRIERDTATRQEARRRYLLGQSNDEVAQALGIPVNRLHQWSSRGGWPAERKAIINATTEKLLKPADDVRERLINEHFARIERVLGSKIDRLHDIPVKKSSDAEQQAKALKILNDVGRQNLGLDAEDRQHNASYSVNLNLGSMTLPPAHSVVNVTPEVVGEPIEEPRAIGEAESEKL